MAIPSFARRVVFTLHVVSSVGWIGAVAAYLALDLTASASDDVETLRAAYISMDLVTQRAIVPLAFASLITGLVISLGTPWGLFRHYWTVISLVLTLLAILVLLSEARVVEAFAGIALDPATTDAELRALPGTLLHSIGGLVVLLVVTVLNIYKPRGLTRYGLRKLREQRDARAGR